jgi:NAD(P)-dependent dehydrogenase (short-subunit alcohol dehydrogenase family)
MTNYSVLVTGANRGIGLGLVERLVANPAVGVVFAAARHPDAPALKALEEKFGKKIHPVSLEVSDEASAAVDILLRSADGVGSVQRSRS